MTVNLNPNDTDEIRRATAQVELQKAELNRSLRAAQRSSERMVRRFGAELKPALTAALVVGGAAVVVGVTMLIVRRSGHGRPRARFATAREPSAASNVVKAAGFWLLRTVAQRAARELVTRLAPRAPGELLEDQRRVHS